jgi:hypothetical protein
MVDLVFAEIQFPTGGAGWKAAMRQRAISMRQALLRHPWAVGLMESRMRPGPADLRHHNATMKSLREAGFSFQTAVHAYCALDSYTYGFALQQKTSPLETPRESGEVVGELGRSGHDYAVEFEVGLDLLLDAIDQLRPQWRLEAS